MRPVAVLASGMVTGVGLTAPATCAAFRAGISGFKETDFISKSGDYVIGCSVPLDRPWRGITKLAHLAAPAIAECLAAAGDVRTETIALQICVAEAERPGRLQGLDDELFPKLMDRLHSKFHPKSSLIARGRVSGAMALDVARRLIHDEGVAYCIVAGVDSFLVGSTIGTYESRHRLLVKGNSNGFIPGEAGTAVLLGPPGTTGGPELCCVAIGFGREEATIASERPLRSDGLVGAYRALFVDGSVTFDDADYRITDCNGEQYGFRDDRLAFNRVARRLKARFDHLHPADSIGEIGAAVGPCILGLALEAARKKYAPPSATEGPPGKGVLCHFSNDEGERAALLLRYLDRDELR